MCGQRAVRRREAVADKRQFCAVSAAMLREHAGRASAFKDNLSHQPVLRRGWAAAVVDRYCLHLWPALRRRERCVCVDVCTALDSDLSFLDLSSGETTR